MIDSDTENRTRSKCKVCIGLAKSVFASETDRNMDLIDSETENEPERVQSVFALHYLQQKQTET